MNFRLEIVEYKNLSQSKLIEKNLYTRICYGNRTFVSPSGIRFAASFQIGGLTDTVCISLKNRQTDTAMYVRNVPLAYFADMPEWRGWIDMYAAGDPRNNRFNPGSFDPKNPQVEIVLAISETPSSMPTLPVLPTLSQDQVGGAPSTTSDVDVHRRNTVPSASVHRDVAEAQWMADHVARAIGQAPAAAQSQQQVSELRENLVSLELQLHGALSREAQLNEERERLRQAVEKGQEDFSGQVAQLKSNLLQVSEELEQSRNERAQEMHLQNELLSSAHTRVRVVEKQLEDADKRNRDSVNRERELERTMQGFQDHLRAKETEVRDMETEIRRLQDHTAEKEAAIEHTRSQCVESEQVLKGELQKMANNAVEQETALQVELRRVKLEAQQRESSLLDELQAAKEQILSQESSLSEALRKLKTEMLESEHQNSQELQKVKTDSIRRSAQLEEKLRNANGDFKIREDTLLADLDLSRNQLSGLEFNLQQEIEQHKKRHAELEKQLQDASKEAESHKLNWERELEVTCVDFRARETQLHKELTASKAGMEEKAKELQTFRDEAAARLRAVDDVTQEARQQAEALESARRNLELAQSASQGWEKKYDAQKNEHEKQMEEALAASNSLQEEKDKVDELYRAAQIREVFYTEKLDEVQRKSEQLQQELQDMVDRHAEFSQERAQLEGILDETRYNLSEKQQIAVDLLQQVKELKQSENVINDTLSHTRHAAGEKDTTIEELKEAISARDSSVSVLQAIVSDNDSKLRKQEERVAELTMQLAERETALHQARDGAINLNENAVSAEILRSATKTMENQLQEMEEDKKRKDHLLEETSQNLLQNQKLVQEMEENLRDKNETIDKLQKQERALTENTSAISESKEAIIRELFTAQETLAKAHTSNSLLQEEIADLKKRFFCTGQQNGNMVDSSRLKELMNEKEAYETRLKLQEENTDLANKLLDEQREENEKLENDNQLMSKALVDAEERNEWLQKENCLVLQQAEGTYSGTEQEWIAEVRQLHMGGNWLYWKQIAQDLEASKSKMQQELEEAMQSRSNGAQATPGQSKFVMMNNVNKAQEKALGYISMAAPKLATMQLPRRSIPSVAQYPGIQLNPNLQTPIKF